MRKNNSIREKNIHHLLSFFHKKKKTNTLWPTTIDPLTATTTTSLDFVSMALA